MMQRILLFQDEDNPKSKSKSKAKGTAKPRKKRQDTNCAFSREGLGFKPKSLIVWKEGIYLL